MTSVADALMDARLGRPSVCYDYCMHSSIPLVIAAQLAAGMPEPAQAEIAWVAEGEFCEPETVLPLPDDTLLVSNVCDFRTSGNGFLTLLDADGQVIDWRVVDNLDAPLGMALVDDLLYVIDNNQVKVFAWPGFDLRSKLALETTVANDIAVSRDHTMYITDTARHEVVVVRDGARQSVLTGKAQFKGANGIEIRGNDLYVGGENLWHVDLEDDTVTRIGPDWLSNIDGIELEPDGTLQVTPVGGPLIRLGEPVEVLGGDAVSSANHGYAAKLGLALVPTGFDNTVIAIRVGVTKNPVP
jgi:hypothetical protein